MSVSGSRPSEADSFHFLSLRRPSLGTLNDQVKKAISLMERPSEKASVHAEEHSADGSLPAIPSKATGMTAKPLGQTGHQLRNPESQLNTERS